MAIRSPPDPSGGGQCFALLRMRIATSGFALLAMTWKLGAGPSILAVPLSKLGGGGNAARPTVRIPYAERKLATGRAVSARLTARKIHQSRVWLRALPGGFIKNLVYFLCKVCYTVISVRRDGQTRAEKKRNTRAFCGQRDHLPDDSGSKGMALAA